MCRLVVLPPRKTRDKDKSSHFQVMKKKKSQAGVSVSLPVSDELIVDQIFLVILLCLGINSTD